VLYIFGYKLLKTVLSLLGLRKDIFWFL